MKKYFFTIVIGLCITTITNAQLKVTSDGKVGITLSSTAVPQAALDLGTAKYAGAGTPLFLMYNDNNTGPFAGTKMGFYADYFPGGNNLNLVFPESSANQGLFTISAKNTAGTTLNKYFSIAGMTGNVGIGTAPSATKQSPYDLGFKAYYSGWTRNLPTTTETLIGIHHPTGLPKKISTGITYAPSDILHVYWNKTPSSGIKSKVFFNSSGSPIYNSSHQIIGYLHTGTTFNDNCTTSLYDGYYFTINASWNYNQNTGPLINTGDPLTNQTSKYRTLAYWLDPLGLGTLSMDGMVCEPFIISKTYSASNEFITKCKIKASNVLIKNNSNITYNVANGLEISNTFEVQLGSSFEVTLNK